MIKRIITGVFLTGVFVFVLFFINTAVLNIIFSAISVVAVYEMSRCIGIEKKYALIWPAYLIALAFPILTYFFETFTLVWFFAALYVYLFYLLALTTFSRGKIDIKESAMAFFAISYVLIGFCAWLVLKYIENGVSLFVLALLCAVATDVAAYFSGMALGKHKLIPDVSPKKTVEGAVGGVIFCAASCVAYGGIVNAVFDLTPRYLSLLLFGVIVSVVSQIGDLVASLIKRSYKIKDYGSFLPGHGGILDRFDSVVATAPFILLLCFNQLIFGDFFLLFS